MGIGCIGIMNEENVSICVWVRGGEKRIKIARNIFRRKTTLLTERIHINL